LGKRGKECASLPVGQNLWLDRLPESRDMGNSLGKFRRTSSVHLHEAQETAHDRKPKVGRSRFEALSTPFRVRPDILDAYLGPTGFAAPESPRKKVPNKIPGGAMRLIPESAMPSDKPRIILPPSRPLRNVARATAWTENFNTAGTAEMASHESSKAQCALNNLPHFLTAGSTARTQDRRFTEKIYT
jgi:hypothetical protein